MIQAAGDKVQHGHEVTRETTKTLTTLHGGSLDGVRVLLGLGGTRDATGDGTRWTRYKNCGERISRPLAGIIPIEPQRQGWCVSWPIT